MENTLMSEVQSGADVNIRSGGYFIARTEALCWHCGLRTGVLALAMPPEHETLDLDGQVDDEGDHESDGDSIDGDAGGNDSAITDADADTTHEAVGLEWQRAGINAFLFYAEYLPDSVRKRLQNLLPSFHLAYSDATLNSYWANHCEHCGRLLGDHELHCEPGGASVPVSEAAAATIELLKIEEPFEASTAGFTFEPEFFSFMRRD